VDRDELQWRIAIHLRRDFPEVPNPDEIASTLAVDLWPTFVGRRAAEEELRELRAALAEQYPDAAAGVRLPWDGTPRD
jgi:hypothetical protein